MKNLKSIKILVVDDLVTARKILIRFLQRLEFENIIEAYSGKNALQILESNKVDLVLCDLNLGDMKGVAVLEALRKVPETQNIPFVIITADMTKNEFVDAIQKGVSDYILKPFNEKTLEDKITKVMG